MNNNLLDAIDQGILDKQMVMRDRIKGPRIGDYVCFQTGELERFSHDWDDSLQTSPGGSFFMCSNGNASFSGGLNPSTPLDKLTLTKNTLPGSFWFFHHNRAGAGCDVNFKVPCRVYMTTAKYNGFLGVGFQSKEVETLKAQLLTVEVE